MKHALHYTFFLLVFISIHSTVKTSENKTTLDGPMSVTLSPQLVARSNKTNTSSTSSLFMEGGSVDKQQQVNTTSQILPEGGLMLSSWSAKQDKNSNIKARKGVSANIYETISSTTMEPCACCVNITTEEQLKNCSCCPANYTIPTSPTPFVTNVTTVTAIEVGNVTTPATPLTRTNTPSKQSTPLSTSSTSTVRTVVPEPEVHHHKPNVTADVPDQQVPAQQEDYVIPVVGIIFAIPLVIILGALVYKKGADLWERRHYRRMDFLIDGIYNQ